MPNARTPGASRLDRVIAEARQAREQREQSYRERALLRTVFGEHRETLVL